MRAWWNLVGWEKHDMHRVGHIDDSDVGVYDRYSGEKVL
jgi:hypothetical protein